MVKSLRNVQDVQGLILDSTVGLFFVGELFHDIFGLSIYVVLKSKSIGPPGWGYTFGLVNSTLELFLLQNLKEIKHEWQKGDEERKTDSKLKDDARRC